MQRVKFGMSQNRAGYGARMTDASDAQIAHRAATMTDFSHLAPQKSSKRYKK
jgi:hypothetical protein